jgi:hypothetical protein
VIRRLTPSQAAGALAALAKVAVNVDPFDFVPAPGVCARLVTLGPFHLRPAEFAAVMSIVGDTPAALANLGFHGSVHGESMWEVTANMYPFEELKRDGAWNGIGSSVLWGLRSEWAVVASDEGHGVIAGSPEFVRRVRAGLPHGEDDLAVVIERLHVGSSAEVAEDESLLRMVRRLYGDLEAERVASQLRNP